MSESQRAAEQSAWDRHVAQALAAATWIIRRPDRRKLALLPGDADSAAAQEGKKP